MMKNHAPLRTFVISLFAAFGLCTSTGCPDDDKEAGGEQTAQEKPSAREELIEEVGGAPGRTIQDVRDRTDRAAAAMERKAQEAAKQLEDDN